MIVGRMTNSECSIQMLPEHLAIDRIVATAQKAQPGEAPFALVLGAGFSHPLVPTARQVVLESLPLWLKPPDKLPAQPKEPTSRVHVIRIGGPSAEQKDKERRMEEVRSAASCFWQNFAKENKSRGLELPLSKLGLPINPSLAYQAAFDPRYTGALGNRSVACNFQRHIMRLGMARLNAAHFLLGSILGVQPNRAAKATGSLQPAYSDDEFRSVPTNCTPGSQSTLLHERHPPSGVGP